MKAMARRDMRFLSWGWPEAHLIEGEVYECQEATNLPDHDYFLLTDHTGREDWVPVLVSDVMLIHEVSDSDGQKAQA